MLAHIAQRTRATPILAEIRPAATRGYARSPSSRSSANATIRAVTRSRSRVTIPYRRRQEAGCGSPSAFPAVLLHQPSGAYARGSRVSVRRQGRSMGLFAPTPPGSSHADTRSSSGRPDVRVLPARCRCHTGRRATGDRYDVSCLDLWSAGGQILPCPRRRPNDLASAQRLAGSAEVPGR